MRECRCGGRMEMRRIEMLGHWGPDGQRVLVTDIPAWVCERCGEQVLDNETARAVEVAVRRAPLPGEQQECMPVRRLAKAVAGD